MARATRSERRNRRKRTPKTKLLIATEDTKSSNRYFRNLIQHTPRYRDSIAISIVTARSNQTAPHQVIQRAIDEAESADLDASLRDSVWAVVDADVLTNATNRNRFEDQLRLAAGRDIKVVIANPCFEHWIRLHVSNCGVDGAHRTARELIAALNTELRGCEHYGSEYKKSEFPYQTLVSKCDSTDAATRAKQQHSQKSATKMTSPHLCQPCVTDIYRLIEWLNDIARIRTEATPARD